MPEAFTGEKCKEDCLLCQERASMQRSIVQEFAGDR